MVDLVFAVIGKRLVRRRGVSPTAGGNRYLRCFFDLPPNLSGCRVYAEFRHDAASAAVRIDGSGMCSAPPEIARCGRFSVRIAAEAGGGIFLTNYENVSLEVM